MPPKPVDAYDDENRQQMHAFDRLVGLPDFVKAASLEPKASLASLPSTSFADPANRAFPCHTKAAAYLANAFFQQAKPLYPKTEAALVQASLNKFAEFWKITHLCNLFNQRMDKIASGGAEDIPDKDYALVYTVEGQKIRRMAMPNAMSVKAAGEYLFANRYMYTYPMRKFAARRILGKALEYDEKAAKGEKVATFVELRFEPDTLNYLERAAGFGTCHPREAAEKVAERAIMLGKSLPDLKVKLAEIAESMSNLHEVQPSELQKLAEVIDEADRASGLNRSYSEGVELPEEMFFRVLEKEAESVVGRFITLQTGRSYDVTDLFKLQLEKVAAVLGKDFIEAVQDDNKQFSAYKFAAIAPTLRGSGANKTLRGRCLVGLCGRCPRVA